MLPARASHLVRAHDLVILVRTNRMTWPGAVPKTQREQCCLEIFQRIKQDSTETVACRGGLMYLHAAGWQIGKKDKIDLDGPKLKEKEGLYTCPPIHARQKPFHCCLKVREELIKVRSSNHNDTRLASISMAIMYHAASTTKGNASPDMA